MFRYFLGGSNVAGAQAAGAQAAGAQAKGHVSGGSELKIITKEADANIQ